MSKTLRASRPESLRTFSNSPPSPQSALVRRQALLAQLLHGVIALLQVAEAHPPEYVRGLGELDLRVLNHLPVVAPRVEEVQPLARQYLDVQLPERPPHGAPVVHHHPDVAVLVTLLAASL